MGKQNQYEHTINVPLLIAGPGIPSGRRIKAQCYLRDLYPTVCELTGVKIPSSVQGTSLTPVIRGEKEELHDSIFGYFTDTQRMMRTADGWKLVSYPKTGRTQLFHVAEDPAELSDLSSDAANSARIMAMRKGLQGFQAGLGNSAAR